MSLPTNAVFKTEDNEIVAIGFCNAGWSVSSKDIPLCASVAHKNAQEMYMLMTVPKIKFQEYNLGVDDSQYKQMIEYANKLMKDHKKDNPKLFDKDWNSLWTTVALYGYKIWRRDLEAVNSGRLNEEDFYAMISGEEYQANPDEARKSFLRNVFGT